MKKDAMIFINPKEAAAVEGMNNCFCPPYITLAHLFHAPKHWGIKPRALKQYQIQYVVSGMVEYEVEGHVYTTKQGDLLFHRPDERHTVRKFEHEPYVCNSIVFHFGAAELPFDDMLGTGHLLGNFQNHPIENMLSLLILNYRSPEYASQMMAQSLLLNILAELSRAVLEQRESQTLSPKNAAKLVLIKNYILNHYQLDIKHKELQVLSGLSRNYIISEFKKTYTLTPMQYLTWVRIEKAKELALQSGYSISEIALLVGYSDVHTFGRIFKKKTGTSLSQFCAGLIK